MYELISCDLLNHAECEIYDDLLTAKCTDWICEVEDKLKELENAECATVADVLHPSRGLPDAGLPLASIQVRAIRSRTTFETICLSRNSPQF